MALSPSPHGPHGSSQFQVRPVSWVLLACGAFWLGLLATALAFLLHS